MLRTLAILSALTILFGQSARACTAFAVYRNGRALMGNNEDFWVTKTKMWFVPQAGSERGGAGKLGRVYFGFNNFYPQGGMNEAGLAFDGFATPFLKVENALGKPPFAGNLLDHAMANCETVEDVIALFKSHDLTFLSNAMLMFADAGGDSVIIEGDEFVRISGDHQVVTNFYQSKTTPEQCGCNRFLTASRTLAEGQSVSVDSCRDILAATRQSGRGMTQYSNVYDLETRVVHLWHFSDFEHPVKIDLAEELKRGAREVDLPSLFPANERFEKYQQERDEQVRKQTEARRAKDFDASTLTGIAGEYHVPDGSDAAVHFAVEGSTLTVTDEQTNETHTLTPEGTDRFFMFGEYGLVTLRFQREAEAVRSVEVNFTEVGRKMTCPKR